MQRDFGNLCKADQRFLLGKNTPLFVQFILATYFCSATGQDQLHCLLGNRHSIMPESKSNSHNIVRKIDPSELCYRLSLFNASANLKVWNGYLNAFSKFTLHPSLVPYMWQIILYDKIISISTPDDEAIFLGGSKNVNEQPARERVKQSDFEDTLKGKLE